MARRSSVLTLLALALVFCGGLAFNPSPSASAAMAAAFTVADFEGGAGGWYGISDKVAGGSSSTNYSVINGGAARTRNALRISGTLTKDFKYGPFAGAGFIFDRNGRDLSGMTGIRFYARGDGGRYRISVPSAAVKNHNEFGKEFVAGKAWRMISIPFAQLAQGNYGPRVQWTGRDVRGVEVTTAGGAPRDFAVEIDQISFY
nr:hypothetical protein [uncultured bacterium]